jgi:hypothetical protein
MLSILGFGLFLLGLSKEPFALELADMLNPALISFYVSSRL